MDGYRKQTFYFKNQHAVVTIKKLFEKSSRRNSTRIIKVREKTGLCSNSGGLSNEME